MATPEVEAFSTQTPDLEHEKETEAVSPPAEDPQGEEQVDNENHYLSGTKLLFLLGAITVPMFLVLLDMSIMAFRQSLGSQATSTLCKTWDGMGVRIS